MKPLVFLDVETTGLNEGRDVILELAMVVVELPRFDEVASFTRVVRPPMLETVRRNVNERVEAMHAASGLWADVEQGGEALHLIEGEAFAFVRKHAPHTPTWQSPLAGANPDFDRRFLKAQMPKLHAAFSYRNFDVRTLTQLSDWVSETTLSENAPHRALADCQKAIRDVRSFLGLT